MCNPNSHNYGLFNPTGKLLGRKYEVADPLMYNYEQSVKSVDIPAPVAPQDIKMPEPTYKRATRRGTGTSTLLTGTGGVSAGSLATGGTTLLGG